MWAPCSPAQRHAVNGAEVIFNCSASNDVIGKDAYRVSLVKKRHRLNITAPTFSPPPDSANPQRTRCFAVTALLPKTALLSQTKRRTALRARFLCRYRYWTYKKRQKKRLLRRFTATIFHSIHLLSVMKTCLAPKA